MNGLGVALIFTGHHLAKLNHGLYSSLAVRCIIFNTFATIQFGTFPKVITRKPVGFMQSCCPVRTMCGRHPDRDPGKYLPELPNFMQYYTQHHAHVIRMSSAHVVCMCTSSAHVICMCTSSTWAHVIRMSSAALLMVSVDLNYLSTLTGSGYWMEFVARMLSCFISGSYKWFVR